MDLVLSKDMTLDKVSETALMFKEQIIHGEVDPIQADYFLKCIEELAKEIRKDVQVKEIILDEADKWEGQSYGGRFPKVQERRTAIIKDAILDELKEKVKNREKLLKSITEDSHVIDEVTGEELQPLEYKISRFIKWER